MEIDLLSIFSRNFTKISPEYKKFAKEKDACRSCSVYEDYLHVLQSEGNAVDPTFLLCGEAAGKEECEQIRPFIGRAGQRLRQELRKHEKVFTKENTLISNVLSCRPYNNVFPKKGQGNIGRHGSYHTEEGLVEDVGHYCMSKWLLREIELCKPKIIIVLGSIAMQYVWSAGGIDDIGKISSSRGEWKFLPKFQAWSMATFHPSYVLRCANSKDSYAAIQFEQDIAKIAKGWRKIISADYRMNIPRDEWKRKAALEVVSSKMIDVGFF